MDHEPQKNVLFQTSHMLILTCYTLFTLILIGESLALGWETWALVLILVCLLISWLIHIRQIIPDLQRLWIYSLLMMGTFFFYGAHTTSTFDLASVMCALLIVYTMTGNKSLTILCQVTYYLTMGYSLIALYRSGQDFDFLTVSRIMLHLTLVFVVGWVARIVIDKWNEVMLKSMDEINLLKDSTNRLNDFLANVSHEIRTPINAVIGLAGVCLEKQPPKEVREDLQSIEEAGKRVANQISDILDYSEIDRKSLARNDEDYMLTSLLHDLVTQLRPYKNPELEMIIDVDPAVPSVMRSDVGKLKKILWHLCMNGMKYTKEGGVYVRIYSLKEPYGINLCIEIKDTGIGMTEEDVERISEGFYQANSGRSRSSSGLGLGMSIVNGFVFSLGGFMSVESETGRGTTVRLSIPQKVIDPRSCMSVENKEKVCIGAYLNFEKYSNPHVREYYNVMVRNIVRGLDVQMHWASNLESLKKLHGSLHLTHLFVGPEEYESDIPFMETLAKEMIVVVVANNDFPLPKNSGAKIMEKPFYCFPVAVILNMGLDEFHQEDTRIRFHDVHVLVVDDEPMNLTVARGIFKQYGMEVTTARSGYESIELCSSGNFDLIFMDHMMPGMDGVEAMKRIRAVRRDIPIIMLTANAVSTAKEMFMKSGFDGFVSKPIELTELERVMKALLPDSRISYESAEAEAGEESETSGQDHELSDLEKAGIDTKTGLHYCQNDLAFYKELLTQFSAEAGEKKTTLKKYYGEQDFPNYAIVVHALKSTSRMIGAAELSEQARELEELSKQGGAGITDQMQADLFSRYDTVLSAIRKSLGDSINTDESGSSPDFSSSAEEDILEFSPVIDENS